MSVRATKIEATFSPVKVTGQRVAVRTGRMITARFSARGVTYTLGPTGAVIDFLWYGDKLDRNGNPYVFGVEFKSDDPALTGQRLCGRRLAPVATRALTGAR